MIHRNNYDAAARAAATSLLGLKSNSPDLGQVGTKRGCDDVCDDRGKYAISRASGGDKIRDEPRRAPGIPQDSIAIYQAQDHGPAPRRPGPPTMKVFTSKYIGVYWAKNNKKWKAGVRVEGKNKHLGYFECEEEAARKYDSVAVFFGRQTNFAPSQTGSGTAVSESMTREI